MVAYFQIRHNRNSVIPVPNIFCGGYDNEICVELNNFGCGVMIIQSLKFIHDDGETSDTLIDLMPMVEEWTTYYSGGTTPVLPPNQNVVLIKTLHFSESEKESIYETLSHITVNLSYMNIYKQKFKYSLKLDDMYLRHLKRALKQSL